MFTHHFNTVLAATIGTVTAATLLLPGAYADLTMKDLKEPLPVSLLTSINGPETDLTTEFKAKLIEDVGYGENELPEGTLFSGTFTKATKSTHLLNPGYVKFMVDRVTYPDGRILTFNDDVKQQKLFHDKANTGRKAAKTAWPFVVVNSIVTLPMKVMGIPGAAAAGLGAKMALGVAREYTRDDKPKDRLHEHKVGVGMVTGTGVPGMMFILSKRPEPELNEGDELNLYLDPDNMELVFMGTRDDFNLPTEDDISLNTTARTAQDNTDATEPAANNDAL